MRIFLVRHGESLGNVDEEAYKTIADHQIPLTQWGHEQAVEAGRFLRTFYRDEADIRDKKPRVYFSPYKRTAQTKDGFIEGFGKDKIESVKEDPALREQSFGVFSQVIKEEEQKELFPHEYRLYKMAREQQGKFYAVPPLGESRAQVVDRIRPFKGTLMRDVSHGNEDFIIFGHGVTNRAIEMSFLHRSVEWFEKEPNPGNCDILLIEGDRQKGYTIQKIYEGKTRPKALPKDYKTAAHESSPAVSP